MSRFRLQPTPEQAAVLEEHCRHARFVWNLCVEQESWWTPRRGPAPGFAQRCRQLTEARAASRWLAAGSVTVQQQAIRDFGQAMAHFFASTHRRPTWRKAGRHEGFRVIAVKAGDVRRLSRQVGEVKVPKAGWVRFRWSRAVPEAKSYRVTRDRAGRWHIAFAVIPSPIPAPGNGGTVGVDRGVAVSAALSTGNLLTCPAPATYTSQRCSRCGYTAGENRESQAVFACRACGHRAHADVNAGINIDTAAGHAAVLRGEGTQATGPVNREPQPELLPSM